MFDIGIGEFIVLAVLALVIFGPEKLPKAASQAGRTVRQLREMATNARKELSDSADLGGVTSDLKSLADLHPKRLLSSALSPDSDGETPAKGTNTPPVATASAPAANGTQVPKAAPAANGTPAPEGNASAAPAGRSASYDPDAT